MKKYRMLAVGALLFTISTAFAGTIYVKHDADGANNGASWNDAFTDLQPGINTAQSGDDCRHLNLLEKIHESQYP